MKTEKISTYIKKIELGYYTKVKCITAFKKIVYINNLNGTKTETVINLIF
jgi:hypothetical protein